jgi:Tol biopolymer transport system component
MAGALGAVAVILTAVWFASGRNTVETSEAPVIRLTSDSGLTTEPALSPDGKLVAYASDRANGDDLDIWVQQIGGGAPLRLTSDSANEYEPTFSPDGAKIAFRSERDGGGIYAIPALGGEPRLVAKGGRHAVFSPDGSRIAFVTGQGGLGGVGGAGLFVVPSTGGTPQKLVPSEIGAASPIWSPDGKFILFAVGEYRMEDWGIVPSSLAEPVPAAGEQQLSTAMSAGHWESLMLLPLEAFKKAGLGDLAPRQWLPGNRILFSAKSGDTSHIFDIGLAQPSLLNRRWHLDSSPKRLTFGTGLEEWPSISSSPATNGSLRLTFASVARSENVWSVALDGNHPQLGGKLQQLTSDSGFDVFPSASADGTKVSFIAHTAYNDTVWFLDLTTGKRTQLSTNISPKSTSFIRRDGSQVYYGDNTLYPDNTPAGIFAASTSGGAPEQLCHVCNTWLWDWSPDRKRILTWDRYGGFVSLNDPTSRSVRAVIVNLETGKRSVFLQHPGEDLYSFQWSPDGKWIAFYGSQVYVIPFTGDRGSDESAWIPLPDSAKSGGPRWSPDGNWIYVSSLRDGFPCIWACPLDPETKRPAGNAIPVYHSHGGRISIRNANATSGGLSIARDKIVFGQGQITGNIWMTELKVH